MVIDVRARFGASLVTRAHASELREAISAALRTEAAVVVDFSGVEFISIGGADEAVGKLILDFPQSVLSARCHLAGIREGLGSIVRTAILWRIRLRWFPGPERDIATRLMEAGHKVYLVGGAVRDGVLGRMPHDADLATSARPEDVLALFEGAKEDGAQFGRVLVAGVDVLTLRRDGVYRDARRPSSVEFTDSIEEDLARRDFTVNALAVDFATGRIIDPFGGAADIENRTLRAVGDTHARIREDALRIMRLVRFAATLGFVIEEETARAASVHADRLGLIAPERIRDELSKLLLGDAVRGLRAMEGLGILRVVLPDIALEVGVEQRTERHYLDVWEHTLAVVGATPANLELRLAALFHDVGKPLTKEHRDGRDTFHRHEQVGAEVARRVLTGLRYPTAIVERVVSLVANHMFNFRANTKTSTVRRFIAKVGPDLVPDLLALRAADRAGSKASPGLGTSGSLLAEVAREMATEAHPLRVADLPVDGCDVMALGIPEGPAVGRALKACLDLVLEDPAKNTRDALLTFLAEWA